MTDRRAFSLPAMTIRPTSAILLVVALGLLGPPVAGAAPGGVYTGRTADDSKVRLKVERNRIVSFVSSVAATCWTGDYRARFVYPPAGRKGPSLKIKRNGSFGVVFGGSSNVSFNDDNRTLKGRFRGGSVTGKLRIAGLCDGQTTFTAERTR